MKYTLTTHKQSITLMRWVSTSSTVATRIRPGLLLSTASSFIWGWKLWAARWRRSRRRLNNTVTCMFGSTTKHVECTFHEVWASLAPHISSTIQLGQVYVFYLRFYRRKMTRLKLLTLFFNQYMLYYIICYVTAELGLDCNKQCLSLFVLITQTFSINQTLLVHSQPLNSGFAFPVVLFSTSPYHRYTQQ